MLFYSTNPRIKLMVQRKYGNDLHYVWCSAYFDSENAPVNTFEHRKGITSDPFQLYKTWRSVCESKDSHHPFVPKMKAGIVKRANDWFRNGTISKEQLDDITYLVRKADYEYFRPVLYIIPTDKIDASRIKKVPLAKCASFGDEYIIGDLMGSEFETVEGL